MSGSLIGFLIEGLLALLLIVTIGYCAILNRRLKRLRTDEATLRAMIVELVQATELAERAIQGFQSTARQCDRDLSEKLDRAERYGGAIEARIEEGEKVLSRLARISGVVRHHGLSERSAGAAEASGEQELPDRAA